MTEVRRCPRCGMTYGKSEAHIPMCDICHVALMPIDIVGSEFKCRPDGLVYLDTGNGATNALFRVVNSQNGCALQFLDKRSGGEVLLTMEQLENIVKKACS